MKVMVILVLVSALAIVYKGLEKRPWKLDIRGRIKTMKALLRPTRILRNVFEIYC